MDKINILIIGFGPHAKRIYFPICKQEENTLGVKIAYGVDLFSKRNEIEEYLKNQNYNLPFLYLNPVKSDFKISHNIAEKLNGIVKEYNIKGVIISTEPSTHVVYASWALSRGLSILMDKPITIHKSASTSESAANKMLEDYYFLEKLYKKSKEKYGKVLFSLMAQRRFHPAFQKIRNLIEEVFQKTNCPITSIQSFHSDGQWRLPSEIIDITYHSYNYGYGKCSHTGYHSLDIVPWLMEAAESKDKEIDNVDIFSNYLRPNDFISQLNLADYTNIFPDFNKVNKYSEIKFRNLTKRYGEIDAFNTFAFKHKKNIITLGNLNFVHNGFSQRGWLMPKKDLYKGNGRVRHESHFIEQGPFQAISFISYQSSEVNPDQNKNLYEVGGEYHLDIHVFRNSNLFPSWEKYQKYSIKDLTDNKIQGYSRGHQEDARRKAVVEFIEFLHGKKSNPQSDYTSHAKGTKLLAGVYLSAARRFNKQNPLVNIQY